MNQDLAIFGDKIVLLSKQLRSADQALSNIPYLISQIISNQMWKLFQHPSASQLIDNSKVTFVNFVEAQPPTGLGGDIQSLENILVLQTRSSNEQDAEEARESLILLTRELEKSLEDTSISSLPDSIVKSLTVKGQKSEISKYKLSAIKRLELKSPDIYNEFVQGKFSLNKAMIEAGLKKRRFSILQEDITGAAKAIRKKLSEEQLLALIKELQ